MKKAVSAGGVIVKRIGATHTVLFLRGDGESRWFLPKGHVEGEETLEEAALREVAEESGYANARVLEHLGAYERYVPQMDEQKTIHYFLMTLKNEEPPSVPEDPRTIREWFPLEEIPPVRLEEQSDVIRKNLEKIREMV